MGIIRIDTCGSSKVLSRGLFFFEASEEIIITAEQHGYSRVPNVAVYDLVGNEIEPSIQVNSETFRVTIRQDFPPIAIYVAFN
jgi:hypothetical protein